MTTTDKLVPLTAEEENALRAETEVDAARGSVIWARDVQRLFYTLDASRADTAAVRRERDALRDAIAMSPRLAPITTERDNLRSLAAELVEGLEVIDALPLEINPSNYSHEDVCDLNNYAVQAALTAQALLSRVRAQGIGGEKEKGNA